MLVKLLLFFYQKKLFKLNLLLRRDYQPIIFLLGKGQQFKFERLNKFDILANL